MNFKAWDCLLHNCDFVVTQVVECYVIGWKSNTVQRNLSIVVTMVPGQYRQVAALLYGGHQTR